MVAKQKFGIDDWVVHSFHGVNQIKAIVDKGVNGNKKSYYKVATNDLEYWIPLEMENNNRIFSVRSKNAFSKALKIMARAPKPLPGHHKARKKRIYKRWSMGNLLSRARLLRDLNGRKYTDKLNFDERATLEKTKKFLLEEMIVADNSISSKEADAMIEEALTKSQQKIKRIT